MSDDYEPTYRVIADKGMARIYVDGQPSGITRIYVGNPNSGDPRPIDFLIADVLYEAETITKADP